MTEADKQEAYRNSADMDGATTNRDAKRLREIKQTERLHAAPDRAWLIAQLEAKDNEIERLKGGIEDLTEAIHDDHKEIVTVRDQLTAEREAKEKLRGAADMPYVEMGDHIWISNDDWDNLQQALTDTEAKDV